MYILRRIAKFVGGQYTGQTRPQKVLQIVFNVQVFKFYITHTY